MSSGQGMMGGGGFDPVCGFVERIVESVASSVFFHALDQGSVGLSGILGGALSLFYFFFFKCLCNRTPDVTVRVPATAPTAIAA